MRQSRKAPRYALLATGTLHPAGERVGTNVRVRDISTLGCGLDHALDPGIGKNCELYLDLRGALLGLAARVVWKDAQGRMGLQFFALDEDSQRRLNELCASLRAQAASGPKEVDTPRAAPSSPQGGGAAHSTRPGRTVPAPRPEPVSQRRYRQLPRYVCELPAQLFTPATEVPATVTLLDLSISGCRVEGSKVPDKGQTCELQTEWEGRGLVLRGEVVWKGKEEAGIAFSSLDGDTMKQLRRICANARLVPPAPLP